MRIALVTPGFPPTRGGVEQHVGQLAAQLAATGHHVEVFTAARGQRRLRTSRVGGVTVRTYPAWRVQSMSVSPRLLAGVLRHHRRFDLLHVHSSHALSGFAAVLGARIPVVLTPHYHGGGHTPVASVLHKAYRRAAVRLFGSAQQIICVSDAELKLLAADFANIPPRATVIPNGIDSEAIHAVEPYPDEPATVLSLGRLAGYKRSDLVVAAVAQLPQVQLVLVGDGAEREALVRQASELGMLGRVRVMSGLNDNAVHRIGIEARQVPTPVRWE